jgi:hypothetical protein
MSALKYWDGSAFRTIPVVQGPPGLGPLFTNVLPAGTDGQVIHFQNAAMATDGVIWTLRYRAASASAYKWEFVGGSPLTAFEDVMVTTTATSPVELGNGPLVTVPLAGDYIVGHGCAQVDNIGTGYATARTYSGAVDNNDHVNQYAQAGADASAVFTRKRVNGVAAGSIIRQRYNASASTARFFGRRMDVTPVRLG